MPKGKSEVDELEFSTIYFPREIIMYVNWWNATSLRGYLITFGLMI
jgi:hypothetical protein